jgi:KTSC domain
MAKRFSATAVRRAREEFSAHAHESECCAALTFVPETALAGTLTVAFQKRGTYVYHEFPVDEWLLFNNAASRGTYFNLYVRDRYSYERIA